MDGVEKMKTGGGKAVMSEEEFDKLTQTLIEWKKLGKIGFDRRLRAEKDAVIIKVSINRFRQILEITEEEGNELIKPLERFLHEKEKIIRGKEEELERMKEEKLGMEKEIRKLQDQVKMAKKEVFSIKDRTRRVGRRQKEWKKTNSPEPTSAKPPKDVECFACGARGHYVSRCPQRREVKLRLKQMEAVNAMEIKAVNKEVDENSEKILEATCTKDVMCTEGTTGLCSSEPTDESELQICVLEESAGEVPEIQSVEKPGGNVTKPDRLRKKETLGILMKDEKKIPKRWDSRNPGFKEEEGGKVVNFAELKNNEKVMVKESRSRESWRRPSERCFSRSKGDTPRKSGFDSEFRKPKHGRLVVLEWDDSISVADFGKLLYEVTQKSRRGWSPRQEENRKNRKEEKRMNESRDARSKMEAKPGSRSHQHHQRSKGSEMRCGEYGQASVNGTSSTNICMPGEDVTVAKDDRVNIVDLSDAGYRCQAVRQCQQWSVKRRRKSGRARNL